jgi:hypothetical protein
MCDIISIYADGGIIGRNPSPVGGTYAFCCVDANNNRIIERGGIVLAPKGKHISSPTIEQIALVMALEYLPEGWSGRVHSDCQVALYRVFKNWRTQGLPGSVAARTTAALNRLGKLEYKLIAGHPTKEDLRRGWSSKKHHLPVSEHNVWTDDEANRQKQLYFDKLKEDELETYRERILSKEEMMNSTLTNIWKSGF